MKAVVSLIVLLSRINGTNSNLSLSVPRDSKAECEIIKKQLEQISRLVMQQVLRLHILFVGVKYNF